MKRSAVWGLALLALSTINGSAHAVDLLGDTLSFQRAYPSIGAPYGQPIADTTVAAGTADQVFWRFAPGGPVLLTIDPEADRIDFSFAVLGITEGSDSVFDGVVITGFDRAIESVSLLGNTAGGSVLLSHTADRIDVNLNGAFQPNESFSIAVSVVPEPASSALLALGAGLLALRLRARAACRRPVGLAPEAPRAAH